MRHCLRTIKTPDPNAWSLRDTDNLPHLTFATYRVEPTDDLTEVPLDQPILNTVVFVQAGAALLMIDLSSRPLKPERRQQLVTFCEHGNPDEWQRFPTSPTERLHAILPNFNFASNLQPTVDRVVASYARNHATPAIHLPVDSRARPNG